MRCVINAKTHFSIRRKNTSGINVPKSTKIGKGSKKILHNHWGYSYFKSLCYVQRLLEIGEEFLQILAGHAHFIAGILDGAVLELNEFGQLIQR